jgi:hypothetical protein
LSIFKLVEINLQIASCNTYTYAPTTIQATCNDELEDPLSGFDIS